MDPLTLDPAYVDATIEAESSGNPHAVSPVGAKGLMQLLDSTGAEDLQNLKSKGQQPPDAEYTPFDPEQNRAVGTSYLQKQYETFKDLKLASVAYNWGPERTQKAIEKYGNSYEDIAAHIPEDTQKYVGKITSRYQKLKNSKENTDTSSEDLVQKTDDTIAKAPPTTKGFAQALSTLTSDPSFDLLPTEDQAQQISKVYKSKQWGADAYDVYQKTMGFVWDSSDSELNINEVIGPPPVLTPGDDPQKTLQEWQDTSVQKLLRQGISPAFFGGRLETYFQNASKAETEAYNARNEGVFSYGAGQVGNFARNIAKGGLSGYLQPLAAIARIGGDSDGGEFISAEKRKELADKLEALPEFLGKPSDTYNYATDEKGFLKLNPDGTPQLKAQSFMHKALDNVAFTIGQIGSFVAGGEVLKATGYTATGVNLALGATGALTVANSAYKKVYEDTNGDVKKSYNAAMLSAPIGFVGSIAELGAVSGEISPMFASMSKYDQARYVAQAFTKRGAAGAATVAGMDIAQQGAEISQTGKPFDPLRTGEAAVGGGLGIGVVGAFTGYFGGRAAFLQNKNAVEADLIRFRDSIDQTVALPTKVVPKDIAENFGLTATVQPDGTTLITKNTSAPVAGTMPELLKTLDSRHTPDEILALGQRQGALASKPIRTQAEEAELTSLSQNIPEYAKAEYLNTTKAVESAINAELQADPSQGMFRWNQETNRWEDPETGYSSPHLKDVLTRQRVVSPEVQTDLSDISDMRILDEEVLAKDEGPTLNPINPKATEEGINLQRQLDKTNADILELQNRKENTPEEEQADVVEAIKGKKAQARQLKADLLKLKPTLDIEEANRVDFNQKKKAFESQKKKDLGLIKRYKDKVLGAISNNRDTIILPSGMTPEGKSQVLAHEIAHAVSDKVKLSDAAKQAVENEVQAFKDKGLVSTASEIADQVLLPEARKLVKVPDNALFSSLTNKSKEALVSEKEFLSNQIGAVILKRNGFDIGNYKILPEIEESLKNTKLPTLTKEPAASQSEKAPSTTQEISNHTPQAPLIKTGTGETAETAYSKTLTETNPNAPKTFYEKASNLVGAPEARALIEKEGFDNVVNMLSKPESYDIDPKSKIVLLNELEKQAQDAINSDPTVANANRLSEVQQIRSSSLTPHAQALSLARKFRTAENFGDFIAAVNKAYRDAKLEPPKFTDFMLKELKTKFDRMKALPESNIKNTESLKLFNDTLKEKGITWKDYFQQYMLTNILSGPGTVLTIGTSGAIMGPLVTALNHPFLGGGLLWRAMYGAKEAGIAHFKLANAGQTGKAFYAGAVDTNPVRLNQAETPQTAFQKVMKKFTYPLRLHGAVYEFMKTLSGEGHLALTKFNELKAKYGDNPVKLAEEIAKIVISKEDMSSARAQAKQEFAKARYESTPAEVDARAYEILKDATASVEQQQEAIEYSKGMSHAGDVANPVQLFADKLLNAQIWNELPLFRPIKNILFPVGNALIRLTDYAQDFVPGNIILDRAIRSNKYYKTVLDPRSPALEARLRVGQKLGAAAALTLLAGVRAGLFRITGDAEEVRGPQKGKRAASRQAFKEFEQKGDPEHSIMFPNGVGVEYKDIPGLNAIAYGVHKMDDAINKGENVLTAVSKFFTGALGYAVPFFGGETSLSSPYLQLWDAITNPETSPNRVQATLDQVKGQLASMTIPWSAFLRDMQKSYEDIPEETHQNLVQKIFRNVPVLSSLVGSEPALTRIGTPEHRTFVERVPGLTRLVSEKETPEDATLQALQNRGLVIKEMPNTMNFFGHTSKNPTNLKFKEDRELRIGKAWGNIFTPDEWNDFRKATGPYIKIAAEQVLDTNLPIEKAQSLLDERVKAIEMQAKKRYIATGHF